MAPMSDSVGRKLLCRGTVRSLTAARVSGGCANIAWGRWVSSLLSTNSAPAAYAAGYPDPARCRAASIL